MIAAALLNSLAAKPGTYTAPGGEPVPMRAIVNDAPGETRREAGEEFMSDAGVAVMSDALDPEEGGLLVVGQATYLLGSCVPSRVPGLVDCDLMRTSGAGTTVADLSAITQGPLSEIVTIDGRPVRVTVARRAETIELDDDGGEVVVLRNRVAIRAIDLGSIDQGSIIVLDGVDLLITAVRPTAAGIYNLIC